MNSSDRNPIDHFAEEFSAGMRRGESPSVEDFVAKYPEHADEIRAVLPAVEMLEQLSRQNAAAAKTEAFLANLNRLGDYRIIGELGRGGMGVVFKAEQESLGRHVALKVLHHGSAMNDVQRQRFEREAQAAAALHHTNIVPVFGVGEHAGHHYYVMQFISGQGLDQWIRQQALAVETSPSQASADRLTDATQASVGACDSSNDSNVGSEKLGTHDDATSQFDAPNVDADVREDDTPNTGSRQARPGDHLQRPQPVRDPQRGACHDWTVIAEIGRQIAQALDYAHRQGTLHRDIKPANLIRDRQGKVWITDFGLAKLAAEADLTQTGDVVGTLRYMAPEQFQGHADERTDVYGLGLVLYELLTLRPAFNEEDRGRLFQQVLGQAPPAPRQIVSGIPLDLETIVLKSIATEPKHRYQTADQLAHDLALCLDDRPIRARRTNWIERLWRWCRRNPALAAASSAVAGLLILVVMLTTYGYFRAVADRRLTQTQQKRAESNLQLALEAFEGLFDRISTNSIPSVEGEIDDEDGARPLLMEVVSADQAVLLQDLLAFYDRFAELNQANPELQTTIAEANWRVGDIERRLQHLDKAEKAYGRALSVYRSQAQSAASAAYAVERSTILNQIGLICQATRRMPAARESHARALALLKLLDEPDRRAGRVQYEMARTLNFMGECDLWWSREFSTARDALESARTLIEGLLDAGLDKADYKYTQAQIYRNLWTALSRESWFRRRRSGEAGPPHPPGPEVIAPKNKAIVILEELISLYPRVPEYRYELCSLLSMTPPLDTLNRAQVESKWIPVLERANQIAGELCSEHREIVPYAMLHGRIQQRLALCAGRVASLADADRSFERAATLLSEYNQRYAGQTMFMRQLAESNLAWGEFLQDHDQSQQAKDRLELATRQIDAYWQQTQDRRVSRLMLHIYDSLAISLDRLGEFDAAAAVIEKAALIEIEEPRPPPQRNRGPGNPAGRRGKGGR